jgi:hypothetical protein
VSVFDEEENLKTVIVWGNTIRTERLSVGKRP